MNETTELIMKQLNAKKVHAETHELGGGDEIDALKLKNIGVLLTQSDLVINILKFGAKGDGVTDDTVAFQNAINQNSGEQVYVPSGTYLIDTIIINTPIKLILHRKATLKARTGGSAILRFTSGSQGSSIEGGTFDGNKTTLKPSYTGTRWDGIVVEDSSSLQVENVKIQNVIGLGLSVNNCPNSILRDITVDNCGWGFKVDSADNSTIENIKVVNLMSDSTNVWQHGIDLNWSKNLTVKNIKVLDSDGNTSGVDAFLSAITISGLEDSVITGVVIDNMQSTTLRPLAFSIINAKNTIFSDLKIRGYGGGRQIECIGMEGCTVENFDIDSNYKIRGAGLVGADNGLVVSNSGYYDADVFSRSNTYSNQNVFRNGTIKRVSFMGSYVWGSNNKFENVKVIGALFHGFIIDTATDNAGTSGAFPGSTATVPNNNQFVNCEAYCCSNSGVFLNKSKDTKIIGGRFENNGDPAGADCGINSSSSGSLDGIEIRDVSVRDTQANMFTVGNKYGSVGVTSLDGSAFTVMIAHTENIFPNQRILLKGIAPDSTDLRVKVIDKHYDEVTVIPESHTSGTLTIPWNFLTGSVTITNGSNVVSGTGTLFTTQLKGRYFVKINNQIRQVARVTSDTQFTVTESFTTSASGTSIQKNDFDVMGRASQYRGVNLATIATNVRVSGINGDGCINSPMSIPYDKVTDDPTLMSNIYAYVGTQQALPAGTWTKVNYTSESFDDLSEYDLTNARFTASKTGIYAFTVSIGADAQVDGGKVSVALYKNGSEFRRIYENYSKTTGACTLKAETIVKLNAGEYTEIFVNTANAFNIQVATSRSYVAIVRLV